MIYWGHVVVFLFIVIWLIRKLQKEITYTTERYKRLWWVSIVVVLFVIGVSAFSLNAVKNVVVKMDKIVSIQMQNNDIEESIQHEITQTFTYTPEEKMILFKKGTLAQLYNVKSIAVFKSAKHGFANVSYSSYSSPVIADLSARQVYIIPSDFRSYADFVKYLQYIGQYFDVKVISFTNKGPHQISSNLLLTQWEWGKANSIQNPYVYVSTIDSDGQLNTVMEGKFFDIYPKLKRDTAYFITLSKPKTDK